MSAIQFLELFGLFGLMQALSVFVLREILARQIEFEFKKREIAAMVAELFAEWTARPDDTRRLNQLAWEAALWLPDGIVADIHKRLHNASDAKDLKEILVDVKSYMHGKKSTVPPCVLVHFPGHRQTGGS